MSIEERCVVCGCPCVDHIPWRYFLRAWLLHRLLQTRATWRGRT